MVSTKIKYSPSECHLLQIITGVDGPISSVKLAKLHYGRRAPFHARKAVVGFVNSLMAKVHQNGETFTIHKSKRQGPKPIEFWRVGK